MCRGPESPVRAEPPELLARQPPPRGRLRRAGRWLGRCARRWLCLRRLLLIALAVAAALAAWVYVQDTVAWRAALRKQGFVDEMPAPAAADRIVVFAPHPDDETLACGGLIQQALQNGARVDVVLMTNGDAAEMALVFGEKDIFVSPKAMIGLGETRQGETLKALGRLGLPAARVHFLSYPNNGLTELWRPAHWYPQDRYSSPYTHTAVSPYARSVTPHAVYCGQGVLADVTSVLQRLRPNKVFLSHPKDAHPDHWATDCFVQYGLATLRARGEEWAGEAEMYGYLVHWTRFPEPARVSVDTDLLPPADLTSVQSRWLRLDLPHEMAHRKLQAIRDYQSQLPQVDRFLLKFGRGNETFEQLLPQTGSLATPTRWPDRGGHRYHLGGAELDALELMVTPAGERAKPDGHASAKLVNGGRQLKKRSFIALDLRAWDAGGAPVVVEVVVQPRGAARATRAMGGAVTTQPVMLYPGAKDLSLNFRVPAELLTKKGLFLSCWGSLKEVDAVVATTVLPEGLGTGG